MTTYAELTMLNVHAVRLAAEHLNSNGSVTLALDIDGHELRLAFARAGLRSWFALRQGLCANDQTMPDYTCWLGDSPDPKPIRAPTVATQRALQHYAHFAMPGDYTSLADTKHGRLQPSTTKSGTDALRAQFEIENRGGSLAMRNGRLTEPSP